MYVHPVCPKSHSKPRGLALSEQPFSSCRPLARPVDSNLTSCDTSASLKVRTSTPALRGLVNSLHVSTLAECPHDYVDFILNIICQGLLGWICVCVACRHIRYAWCICRTLKGFCKMIASYCIPLLLHLFASFSTSWTKIHTLA